MSTPDYPSPTEQQNKSSNGCLIAAAIVGFLVLILIVAVVGVGMWGFSEAKDRISMEPAKVTEMSDKIATMETGGNWSPQFSMDLTFFRMALYTETSGTDGVLVICDASTKHVGKGADFEQQMRSNIEQNMNQNKEIEKTKTISSERQPFIVRGQESDFLVSQTEGVNSGTRYLEISGSFEAKEPGRSGFLFVRAPELSVSVDEIKKLVETIE